MRRLTRGLCSAAVVVVMTACGGSATTPTKPTTTPTTTQTQTKPTKPTKPSQPAMFPLTITRVGGIAGFQDALVVAEDGLVSVTHKGQKWQCRLASKALGRLTTAAADVPWPRITPASTAPSFPDDLVSMVRSPTGGPVRLEDPKVGAGGRVFQELLNDLNGGPAASRTCAPV